jgi:RHS repeat-associated protein
VNWFTKAWHAATHPGQLVSDGEHLFGQLADQGAHLAGRALTDAGLGQLGNTVDSWGDAAASALDPELQLGQTGDPTQLIHGSPGDIRSVAEQLHGFSGAFGQTASGLNGIDTSHWTGAAADAFREKYSPEPRKWQAAASASGDAGGALESYAGTVEWAQWQAREAIALYSQGQKATSAAVTAYNDQVNAYNTAASRYDAKLAGGQNPGTRPVKPGAFSDPGADLREQAQTILNAARAERDRAGTQAASVVSRATDQAPSSPGFWSQVGDSATDWAQAQELGDVSALAGIMTGTADLGKFARDLNPVDEWNMNHPNEYLAGLSSITAGLTHDLVHPQDLAGQVLGGGWGSDPFEAAGKLIPQAALALATDGAGSAGDAAADAGADAAADAGADAAASAADAAGDAGGKLSDAGTSDPAGAAQPKDGQEPVVDPVDVVTGNVILYEVDAELPGVLPLVVRRAHRSSYRAGRWFGRTWASTLDQRLEVSAKGVFVGDDDGVILSYPHPEQGGEPVFPVAAAPWPLERDSKGYTVTDPQAGVVRRFEPRSGFYLSAEGYGELPLVSVTDRTGHKIRFDYTPDGTPLTITHNGGYQIKVLTAGNRIAALTLAGAGAQGRDVPLIAYRYDEKGNLAEVINSSGRPYRFFYDEVGRVTGWEDRNGFSYRYYYDEQGRCVRGEGPGGALSGTISYDRDTMITTYTDAGGAVTHYQISPQARVAAVTDPLGNTTRSDYDACGRLVARTDPLGRVTRWTYDQNGNLVIITRPDGSKATTAYNNQNLPIVITEPGGATWRQDYDHSRNLTQLTTPDSAVTRYSYDELGHLAVVTGPDGTVTAVECNQAGLPIVVIGPDGAITRYERNTFGRIVAVTAPDGSVTGLTWTIEGRLASRIFPDGTAERYSYDAEGNLTEHKDAVTGVTRVEYGCFNQVATRTESDGTRTEFTYDHLLQPINVRIGRNFGSSRGFGALTWRWDYDEVGNLVAETDYNGGTTRYRHDAARQLAGQVNAVGQELDYAYDLLGNLAESRADGSVARFDYDAAGRLIRAENRDSLVEVERDAMGRITAETCNGRTVRSSYDATGRLICRMTPSDTETRWAYDRAGRPASLSTAGQELRFRYDKTGQETLRELPGSARLFQQWQPGERLAAQVLTGVRSQVLQRRSYYYRADGALAGLDDLLSGPRRLALDAVGRVTGVAGPDWTERYAYDAAGNISTATWPTPPASLAAGLGGVDMQGPRQYVGTLITQAGNVRYQHDRHGRIIMRQRSRISRKADTWHYQWDADDRLTAVTTPDGTIWRYLYDPFGRRIAKQRLDQDGLVAEQTNFTWDGRVLAEQTILTAQHSSSITGPSGDPVQVITWDYQPGTFTPIVQAERGALPGVSHEQIDQRFYAIITDLVGTPSELVSPDGTLAGYQQHTLWGATLWHPGGASTPLRFPGQYHDPETGLHYNHHRYYDPLTGRYLTPDPLGLAPGPNPHAYVGNPTKLIDPSGLAGVDGCPNSGANLPAAPRVPGQEITQYFNSLNDARAAAIKSSGIGQDAVPFVQEIGPDAGRVTGMQSPDGAQGWRLDWEPGKGFHVNWWDRTGGPKRASWYYGANIVNGGTWDDYQSLLSHFPKL